MIRPLICMHARGLMARRDTCSVRLVDSLTHRHLPHRGPSPLAPPALVKPSGRTGWRSASRPAPPRPVCAPPCRTAGRPPPPTRLRIVHLQRSHAGLARQATLTKPGPPTADAVQRRRRGQPAKPWPRPLYLRAVSAPISRASSHRATGSAGLGAHTVRPVSTARSGAAPCLPSLISRCAE